MRDANDDVPGTRAPPWGSDGEWGKDKPVASIENPYKSVGRRGARIYTGNPGIFHENALYFRLCREDREKFELSLQVAKCPVSEQSGSVQSGCVDEVFASRCRDAFRPCAD
jgi:hypothetical protein